LILQWVTHSLRPLRLLELAAIINATPNRGGLQQDQDAKIAVRSACGPLLEICEDEVVQIIHHSFTEYLLNSDVSHIQMATNDSLRFPIIKPHEAHKNITLACLSYLKSGCFDDWDAGKKSRDDDECKAMREKTLRFQFLQYAARYWPLHAAKVADLDLKLFSEFDAFLRFDNHDFESWKDFWNGMSTKVPELLSPLHVAAYSGLASYTEHLLAGGADPSIRDSRQTTPLIYSAMEGHSSTATVLLEYGAYYGCVDSSGLNAVHYSSKMNHAAVLSVLLAARAEPLIPKADQDLNTTHYSLHSVRNNQVEVPSETALFYVCENGHVEALVELMKYVDSTTLSHGPLHWAAAMGRAKILNVLLKNDQVRSHINDKDGNGNTALYLASNARDPTAVRVLLEQGADVNARSEHLSVDRRFPITEPRVSVPKLGYTPLHGWARLGGPHYSQRAEDGMEDVKEVLELLLKFGCDINAQDERGKTVLFAVRIPTFLTFLSTLKCNLPWFRACIPPALKTSICFNCFLIVSKFEDADSLTI
jgi:ankyrin repeat protein